jgi:hypothetical protein
MPAGQGNDRDFHGIEVFAAAVDRGVDPAACDVELARDLELVALLQASAPELGPRPDERARSRAAVLARLAAAQDPSDHAEVPGTAGPGEPQGGARPGGTALLEAVPDPAPAAAPEAAAEPERPRDELAARRARRSRRHAMPSGATRRPPVGGRILVVAAAAVLGAAVLGGAGVLASRDALPGDGLYAIKRVAESAGLAMTFDDTERGRRHLELASTRIGEVEQLLAQDPAAVQPEVFRSALHDFDTEADQGSRLLLASPDLSREQVEAEWRAWAADQATRLAALHGDLPGPVATDAAGSLERLEQLAGPGAFEAALPCADGTAPLDAACAGGTAVPLVPGAAPTGPVPPGAAQTERAPGTAPSTSTGPTTRSPGGTAPPDGGGQGGLLPGVLPETPLDGVLGGSDDQGPSQPDRSDDGDAPGSDGGDGPLPPLEVPPLLPGLPGVSIGG